MAIGLGLDKNLVPEMGKNMCGVLYDIATAPLLGVSPLIDPGSIHTLYSTI